MGWDGTRIFVQPPRVLALGFAIQGNGGLFTYTHITLVLGGSSFSSSGCFLFVLMACM